MIDKVLDMVASGRNEEGTAEKAIVVSDSIETMPNNDASMGLGIAITPKPTKRRSESLARKLSEATVPIRIPTKPRPVYTPHARPPKYCHMITHPPTSQPSQLTPIVSIEQTCMIRSTSTSSDTLPSCSTSEVEVPSIKLNWPKPQKVSIDDIVKAVNERSGDDAFELAEAFATRWGLSAEETEMVRLRLTAVRVTHRIVAEKLRKIVTSSTNILQVTAELQKLIEKYSDGPDPRVCE